MRVQKVNVEPMGFQPMGIEIVFETEEEQKEMYGVFNYTAITDSLKHLNAGKIRDVLGNIDYMNDKQYYDFKTSVKTIAKQQSI